MSYQQAVFANNEIYHIYNRGVEKRQTYLDKRDNERFIQTMFYYQLKKPPTRFSFKDRPQIISTNKGAEVLVEVLAFCIMPTHYHLLVRQVEEKGISKMLSKINNSYTRFFNIKHNRVGPLFQGSFKAVRIEDQYQLQHVCRYIHLNPLIDYLVTDLSDYPFSSYRQFIGQEDGCCVTRVILDDFKTREDYKKFVLDQEDYGRAIKFMKRLVLEEVSA